MKTSLIDKTPKYLTFVADDGERYYYHFVVMRNDWEPSPYAWLAGWFHVDLENGRVEYGNSIIIQFAGHLHDAIQGAYDQYRELVDHKQIRDGICFVNPTLYDTSVKSGFSFVKLGEFIGAKKAF